MKTADKKQLDPKFIAELDLMLNEIKNCPNELRKYYETRIKVILNLK